MTGKLRGILWLLGSLGVAWLLLGFASLPAMGRMMGGGAMVQGGMMNGGIGGMMSMMGLMAVQFIAMLVLVGVFVYLVVDSRRSRSAR